MVQIRQGYRADQPGLVVEVIAVEPLFIWSDYLEIWRDQSNIDERKSRIEASSWSIFPTCWRIETKGTLRALFNPTEQHSVPEMENQLPIPNDVSSSLSSDPQTFQCRVTAASSISLSRWTISSFEITKSLCSNPRLDEKAEAFSSFSRPPTANNHQSASWFGFSWRWACLSSDPSLRSLSSRNASIARNTATTFPSHSIRIASSLWILDSDYSSWKAEWICSVTLIKISFTRLPPVTDRGYRNDQVGTRERSQLKSWVAHLKSP